MLKKLVVFEFHHHDFGDCAVTFFEQESEVLLELDEGQTMHKEDNHRRKWKPCWTHVKDLVTLHGMTARMKKTAATEED